MCWKHASRQLRQKWHRFHDGLIEESTNLWLSPIMVVPKLDGSLRICNDFWKLNKVMDFNVYPMLQVDELIK